MAFALTVAVTVLGALLTLVGGWYWLRDPVRHRCPGPTVPWRRRLLPWWIVYRPRCGYDLGGHAFREREPITCPECGRNVRCRRQLVRSTRAWRPVGCGAAIIATAVLLYRYPPMAATMLVAMAPTEVLLRGENMLGTRAPLEARTELRRRAADGDLSNGQTNRFVRLLVNDLRNDSIAGNAKESFRMLETTAILDVQPLIDALDSEDAQLRAMAARLLRFLSTQDSLDTDTPDALIRVSVNELRSDRRNRHAGEAREFLQMHPTKSEPYLLDALESDDEQQRQEAVALLQIHPPSGPALERFLRVNVRNLALGGGFRVGDAYRFLLTQGRAADALLLEGMQASDPQTRLLCAAVAGISDRRDLASLAVPILASHLADNAIRGDAVIAARSLAGFGDAVVPLLAPYRSDDARGVQDEQQRQSIEYIVRRLTTSETTVRLQLRFPLARLTHDGTDALSIAPAYLDMPRF